MSKQCTIVVIIVGISLLAGCGSGGQANPTSQATSQTASNPTSSGGTGSAHTVVSGSALGNSRVLLGGTQQYSAPGTSITWEINGVPGGNDLVGTISPSGLYTAPAVVPLNPVVKVTAKSQPSDTWYEMLADVGALTGTQFAYVSSASDDSIQIFVADGKTGKLQPTSTFSVGAGRGPTALAVSPNGKSLFSLNRGSNDISIYSINPATGDLADAGSVPVPNGPNSMVFSAKGDFAYVSCDGASTIATYALSAGALTPLSSSSYAAGGGRIQSLAMSPDGKFLYAVNRDANQILGLAINQEDGSLSPIAGSPFSAQPGLASIVVSPGDYSGDYQHLYAGSDNGVDAYDRNSSSGALTYLPSATQTTGGKSPELFGNMSDGLLIGVDPQSGKGFSFAFDYLGLPPGALTTGGSSVSTGTSPVAGAWMWHDNGFVNWVFVLNRKADAGSTTGSIGVYQVDYAHGLVGASTTIPTALHDPTGFVITP